jgi:hypothetical protein
MALIRSKYHIETENCPSASYLYKSYINQQPILIAEQNAILVPVLVPIIIFSRSFTSTLPTIHFRPKQHPTPGATPPLHQMGLLVLVCITNVDEESALELSGASLRVSGTCGQDL